MAHPKLGVARGPRGPWSWGALAILVNLQLACGGGGSGPVNPTGPSAPLTTIRPGDVLPLATTVRITATGDYQVPPGATLLTTRCTGSVTVRFSTGSGAPEANTCTSHDGTVSQTNVVTGAERVRFELAPGALADVTLN